MEQTANSKDSPRVVIVGAGFGGLLAALGLRGAPAAVTVVDRTNHHLFQPLLYQVATAGLSPADIAAPIRSVLGRARNIEVRMAEVVGVDTRRRCVQLRSGGEIPYDFLVLAPGSHYNYFGHEDWKPSAPDLKTIHDATGIRQKLLLAFEAAELQPDPARRQALMTFALVGAGPTGVEMAGAIAELAHRALARDFRRINPHSTRILLLEAGPRILSAFPESLASAAQKELERLGVEVRVNAMVEHVDAEGVIVSGERIPCRTTLWTAGVVAAPVGEWLGVPTDKGGRIAVEPNLSVPGLPGVFVIGDAARFEQDSKPLPGVAPVAMQQGRYVARWIRRRAEGRSEPGPFRYHDKGNLATVGRSFAVLEMGRIRLSGFIAWLTWLVVHIWYLIGFRNRLLVLMQWAWAYFTYQRGARLITSEAAPQVESGAPTGQSEERTETVAPLRRAS